MRSSTLHVREGSQQTLHESNVSQGLRVIWTGVWRIRSQAEETGSNTDVTASSVATKRILTTLRR